MRISLRNSLSLISLTAFLLFALAVSGASAADNVAGQAPQASQSGGGLFGIFKKKGLPPVAPPPRAANPQAGRTVFLTEFGPMTSQEYNRNLEILRERQWKEAERARKAAYAAGGARAAQPVEAIPVTQEQLEAEARLQARREAVEKARLARDKARELAAIEEAEARRIAEQKARELAEARKAEETRALREREMLAARAAEEEEFRQREAARARADEEKRLEKEAWARAKEEKRLAKAAREAEEERLEMAAREAEAKRLEQERLEMAAREAEAKRLEQERLEMAAREAEAKRLEQERLEMAAREAEAKRREAAARQVEEERKLKQARIAAQTRAEAQAQALAAETRVEESGATGSRLGKLNNSIFKIVKKRIEGGITRDGEGATDTVRKFSPESFAGLSPGDDLVLVRERAPFYLWGPMQGLAPDETLPLGERVTLVSHGKIWSEVRLASGKKGLVANDFMEPAPAAEITVTKNAGGGREAGAYQFEYPPLSKDHQPPELPDAPDEVIIKSSLLPPIGAD